MLNTDADALACDLMETYGIRNMKELSCKEMALFSCGLREDSRIKMKMQGAEVSNIQMMLAAIVDRLSLLVWFQTSDGAKGVNRPSSLLDSMLGIGEEKEVVGFESADEFDKKWKSLTERA